MQEVRYKEQEREKDLERIWAEEERISIENKEVHIKEPFVEVQEAKNRKILEVIKHGIFTQDGINILSKIREENDASSEEFIDDILMDQCTPDKIHSFIKYIPFGKKIDLLLDLINKRNKTINKGGVVGERAKPDGLNRRFPTPD